MTGRRRAWCWMPVVLLLTGCWDVNVLLRNSSTAAVSMQAIVGDASPPPVAGDAVGANGGARGELLTVNTGDTIKFAVILGDFTRIETVPIPAPLDDFEVEWDGTQINIMLTKGTPDRGQVLVENTTGMPVDLFPTLQPGIITAVNAMGFRIDEPASDPGKLNAVQYEVRVNNITQQAVTVRNLSSSGHRVVWNGTLLSTQPVASKVSSTITAVTKTVARKVR
jgi:hypothetical protein